ncbi:retrovirus-related Pol polyprotein from transposon 17.6 [Trichonephila inaurata madagascariensis]|uniref:Retrovirus-related Pol polyprotein from transposon 17.6 n=1 Tax=Trichonephila inaurata madagascariensis TaxID=2747483 RepID=A0A8X6XBI8_9ARAC|nr:retrovirus-related Pol polyprotein from transposon 17.6 [Trichonephila inaurata madagascariensis]
MLNFYRRFLPHAAEAQAHLNKLLTNCKKNDKRPLPWNEEAQTAFMQRKSSLANVATLNYPTPDQQLCLLVDASNSIVGGALNCLTENGPQPIAFFSRKLSATETKYSTVEGLKPSLTAPYQGPFEVLSKTDKHFTIKISDKTSTISIDRLKPVFLLNDTDSTKEPFPVQKVTIRLYFLLDLIKMCPHQRRLALVERSDSTRSTCEFS